MRTLLLLLALLIPFACLAQSQPSNALTQLPKQSPNQFTEIQIFPLLNGEHVQCHSTDIKDDQWQIISIKELPQNMRLCLRARIHIDKSHLASKQSLFVSMLAASKLYWDGKLISQNGIVGDNAENESPGTVSTIVRLTNEQLDNGVHLLSGEISTFNVGKQLDSIGYFLSIINEQTLENTILALSVFCAFFIGASTILAIIFQLVYWLYQKETYYQIFSVFCLASAFILTIEQIKFWLDYPYDWHVIRLSLIFVFTFIASLLLPVFYIFSYQLTYKKRITLGFFITLTMLSFISSSFDETSIILFSGALLCALAINIHQQVTNKKGGVNIVILSLSLLFIYMLPEYFTEFGFSIVFVFIVMTMLISLIKEMHNNKAEALKAERIRTELLRRNMQPHFLMNCLTQLMELIEVSPKSAVDFIAVLSDEFRQLTIQNNKQQIALSDEITLCNKHLEIMSFRYQQTYKLIINGDVSGIVIPPSILHSQIENCFTHNEVASDRAFELTASHEAGRIVLLLKTPIAKKINHKGTGTGEQYIKAKLAEVDQIKHHLNKGKLSTFNSYEEAQYWVSHYSFNA